MPQMNQFMRRAFLARELTVLMAMTLLKGLKRTSLSLPRARCSRHAKRLGLLIFVRYSVGVIYVNTTVRGHIQCYDHRRRAQRNVMLLNAQAYLGPIINQQALLSSVSGTLQESLAVPWSGKLFQRRRFRGRAGSRRPTGVKFIV